MEALGFKNSCSNVQGTLQIECALTQIGVGKRFLMSCKALENILPEPDLELTVIISTGLSWWVCCDQQSILSELILVSPDGNDCSEPGIGKGHVATSYSLVNCWVLRLYAQLWRVDLSHSTANGVAAIHFGTSIL